MKSPRLPAGSLWRWDMHTNIHPVVQTANLRQSSAMRSQPKNVRAAGYVYRTLVWYVHFIIRFAIAVLVRVLYCYIEYSYRARLSRKTSNRIHKNSDIYANIP